MGQEGIEEYGRIEISWPLAEAGQPGEVPWPPADDFAGATIRRMAEEFGIQAANKAAWDIDLVLRLEAAIADLGGKETDSGTGLGMRDLGLKVEDMANLHAAFDRVVGVLAADSAIPDSATINAYRIPEGSDYDWPLMESVVLGSRR